MNINKHFKFICLNFLLFFVFLSLGLPVLADDTENKTKSGLDATMGEVSGLKTEGGVSGTIGSIIGSILAFVGVLFFVLVVYGGLLWMTARGNEQQVEKAKSLITSAIIGLIIVLSAYAITAFIGTTLTS